ncbi:hypothetical protein B0H14DRAFT_3869487, partial [Mycena olivaceomarginata]
MAFLSFMKSDPTDELFKVFCALARLIGRRLARLNVCGIAAIVGQDEIPRGGCLVSADRSSHDKYHLVDVFGENGRNIVTHHA